MHRFAAAILLTLVAAVAPARAQGLSGRIEGDRYVSATGAFSMPIPVLQALGGTVTDTSNVVTFKDSYNTMISVGAFPMDATERWEFSTKGTRDYLIQFFALNVIPEFRRAFPSLTIEGSQGTFMPGLEGGARLSFFLIPGGSAVVEASNPFATPATPPVAKRGNLVFVKNNVTYVISTELAERVTLGTSYKKTPAEEDEQLKKRIQEIVAGISFTAAPSAKP